MVYKFVYSRKISIFVYGTAVSGENFTDRKEETARIKKDFEAGLNTILISPRRMGKTSLIKKVRRFLSAFFSRNTEVHGQDRELDIIPAEYD